MPDIPEQEYKRRMRLLLGNRWHKFGEYGACKGFRLVKTVAASGYEKHSTCWGCPDCADRNQLLEELAHG